MEIPVGLSHSASRTCFIKNKLGLHARAAALFVQLASKYTCDITVEKNGQEVNAKSIMGILILAAAKGSTIVLNAQGADAAAAVDALSGLIDNLFGEDE